MAINDSMTRLRGKVPDLDKVTDPGESRAIIKDSGPSQATTLTVANMVRQGASMFSIGRKIGISHKRLQAWLDKDPEESSKLERLFQSTVAEAIAEISGKAMKTIMDSIESGDSKTAQWVLERTNPEQFSTKSRVELTGADGGAIALAAMSKEEVLKQVKADLDEIEAMKRAAIETIGEHSDE